MRRVISVYGTRPEAIKMAPLVSALNDDPDIEHLVAVSGQHRHMLDQVNRHFGIVPDHDLDIIRESQGLSDIFTRTMEGLTPVLESFRPEALIVQGDTSTSTAAALAAFYSKVPVIHVEAGLRSRDLRSPFPEEGNRRLTAQVTALHLAPTQTSRENLLEEGTDPTSIAVTGNTVIDALLEVVKHRVPFEDDHLAEIVGSQQPIVLVTLHRRENQGEGMHSAARAIGRVARRHPSWQFVFPVHRSPSVRAAVLPGLQGIDNVLLIEPLDYGQFTHLLSACQLVLTDSGGIQEEAPALGKPVLVLRDTTERPEAVVAGTVKLVGTDEHRLFEEADRLITDSTAYATMANAVNPYGDGRATRRCAAAVRQLLDLGRREPDFAPDLLGRSGLLGASRA
ncbi:UDP-N-acetylglucosamine 2-epimerase (non-hydrolyzing) [Nocardioides guangzhouensis]|uniref:UDP-N-acetylglucosamine 2-epimerase (non-hydrolyzing) n=1 Tax=Nocardioides guangzhouensis TaxID=2497878 RepID=A0A4Q4Z7N1_9ACTN|nr:UDP-N-acetylglucosamine 2-epimerase (non-hydrolyzing) [Nocardioides guangzhouensis]RYP83161.1 UDP-N-acetylglucosamine 2-epimerase (non-hydrolyzing) [Nocardioides guangzhouensis]